MAGLPAAYGVSKYVNEAWAAGVLAVGAAPAAAAGAGMLAMSEDLREVWAERVAIMVAGGGVPSADAERLAWVELQAQRTAR